MCKLWIYLIQYYDYITIFWLLFLDPIQNESESCNPLLYAYYFKVSLFNYFRILVYFKVFFNVTKKHF